MRRTEPSRTDRPGPAARRGRRLCFALETIGILPTARTCLHTSRGGGQMPTTYSELPNSAFLDYDSYRSGATPLSGGTPVAHFSFNVGLVLDRASDPTALLEADWGSRQQQLESLNNNGTLWSTYGADPATYNQVLSDLGSMGIQTVDQLGSNGYVSSVEARTV